MVGRKRLSETEETVRISIRVPLSIKQTAMKLGNGSVSEGVRLLVEAGIETFEWDNDEPDEEQYYRSRNHSHG